MCDLYLYFFGKVAYIDLYKSQNYIMFEFFILILFYYFILFYYYDWIQNQLYVKDVPELSLDPPISLKNRTGNWRCYAIDKEDRTGFMVVGSPAVSFPFLSFLSLLRSPPPVPPSLRWPNSLTAVSGTRGKRTSRKKGSRKELIHHLSLNAQPGLKA